MRLHIGLAVAAAAVEAASVLHERRGFSASTHHAARAVDADAILPMRIGLTQQNLDKAYDYLIDISAPDSKNYGKHWDSGDVSKAFAPAQESVDTVLSWLKASGIEHARQTANKGWISFDASASQAGRLFETTFREYEDKDGVVRIGCDEYSLPDGLAGHVDYLVPGIKLSPPVKRTTKPKRNTNGIPAGRLWRAPPSKPPTWRPGGWSPPSGQLPPEIASCGFNITPPCYRYLYNIPEPQDIDVPAGIMGVFEYQDTYLQSDLDLYFQNLAPFVPNGTHPTLYSVNNATVNIKADNTGESDIDFSIIYSILGPANVSLYQTQMPTNSSAYNQVTLVDPFLDAIDGSYCDDAQRSGGFQCGVYPLTEVVSFSYELPELFQSSMAYQVRACNEFMKLSLQGHTFVFSSGDYGVASNPAFGFAIPCIVNGCIPQDLNMDVTYPFNGTIFSPNFPSNCPYVLSVGATQLEPGQTVEDPESVLEQDGLGLACASNNVTFSSSGGFANYFPRPSYQDAAVNSYFERSVPSYPYYESNYVDVTNNSTSIGKDGGIYNRNGRAIPDVSANGAHYLYYHNGKLSQTYGTSLATPLWASLIAIINADRKAANKSPVGFVNPSLYKNPWIFNDAKNGSNPGCFTDGFPAVEGWDPSTGLGTPNFGRMRELFAGLP